jgi:RNA polymerase sigma-70 factor, ECF subfamily
MPVSTFNSDFTEPALRLCKAREITYAWQPMHRELTDEQLMLRYRDGDALAFEHLYTRFKQPLHRYLQHQCGNKATAEELFQDVWMNLIKARERYEVTASFKTFIYRMAHNRLIDHYRRQRHGVPLSYSDDEVLQNSADFADPVNPEQTVAGQQQWQILLRAIETLPEAQREAFLLKENTGLSIEEIATITDVNSETAKSRLRYAVNKLRIALEL